MKRGLGFLLACAVVMSAAVAYGHGRSASYSSWQVEGNTARVRLRVSLLDLDALGGWLGRNQAASLPDHLQAALRLEGCLPEAGSFQTLATERGFRAYEWRVRCKGEPTQLTSELLFPVVPAHVHFADVHRAGARFERVLTESAPSATLALDRHAGPLAFVRTGIGHILGGIDHLVFLLALVLLGGTLRRLAVVVTGFTLGHSLSLALAVTGQVQPAAATVEALIGMSIALVAVENVWLVGGKKGWLLPASAVAGVALLSGAVAWGGQVSHVALVGAAVFAGSYYALVGRARSPERWRVAVAALFGLVHGFGFASALLEMALPRQSLVGALLAFNVGVEVGQLFVLAVAWLALAALARANVRWRLLAVDWGSAAAMTAGVFWLVSRSF